MQYNSVSYDSDDTYKKYSSCEKSPFDDWKSKNCCKGTVFMYSNFNLDDLVKIHYIPHEKLFRFNFDFDYFTGEIVGTLDVNIVTKTITITSFICITHNYDDYINGELPDTGKGGIERLNTIQECVETNFMEVFIEEMFGDDWTLNIPDNIPEISENEIHISHIYEKKIWCSTGPWNRTIGLYDNREYAEEAAIKIQAAFRGWRERMRYRFNPHTSLGKYYAMKLFLK